MRSCMYVEYNAVVPKNGNIPRNKGRQGERKVRYVRIQLGGSRAEPATALRDKILNWCLARGVEEGGKKCCALDRQQGETSECLGRRYRCEG